MMASLLNEWSTGGGNSAPLNLTGDEESAVGAGRKYCYCNCYYYCTYHCYILLLLQLHITIPIIFQLCKHMCGVDMY